MSSFDDAFTALIGNEGGFVDNKADPGGATRWGVTERVARANGYTGDMRALPIDTARMIAKRVYWDPLHLDEFDPRIAFQMLEANYNGGFTVKWAQMGAGVSPDGKLGPITIAAIKVADPQKFCLIFIGQRLAYLASLKTWPNFGRGWSNRIARCLARAAGQAT